MDKIGAGATPQLTVTDTGQAPITDEELIAEHLDDIIVPLVGTPGPSPDTIEIVPEVLIPYDLPVSEGARQEVIELIRKIQPLNPSLTSDHHDRQFMLAKWRIEKVEKDTRKDVGWAALHAYCNFPQRNFGVRRSLLRVGARVSPEEAKPLLKHLSFTYGPYLEDRAEALQFLAEIAPEEFFEGARPYLERTGHPFQTAPQDEFFARGWLVACEQTKKSSVPMMSQVAMNFAMGDMARTLAIRSLKDAGDNPLARSALESVLVESTGNFYIRRIAAQSIVGGYSREQACAVLQRVADRESDINFARFLDDMLQTNCR